MRADFYLDDTTSQVWRTITLPDNVQDWKLHVDGEEVRFYRYKGVPWGEAVFFPSREATQ